MLQCWVLEGCMYVIPLSGACAAGQPDVLRHATDDCSGVKGRLGEQSHTVPAYGQSAGLTCALNDCICCVKGGPVQLELKGQVLAVDKAHSLCGAAPNQHLAKVQSRAVKGHTRLRHLAHQQKQDLQLVLGDAETPKRLLHREAVLKVAQVRQLANELDPELCSGML